MPYVTYFVIALAIINYFRLYKLRQKESEDLALMDAGALQTPYIGGWKECYRLVTAAFVHMSFYHLFMNIYCLYSLGSTLEYLFGSTDFAIILFGSIILGNAFTILLGGNEHAISGGLSSGIYGLLATEIIIYYLFYGISGIIGNTSLLITILINIAFNFMPGVGWRAHLGGACFGALFIAAIYYF